MRWNWAEYCCSGHMAAVDVDHPPALEIRSQVPKKLAMFFCQGKIGNLTWFLLLIGCWTKHQLYNPYSHCHCTPQSLSLSLPLPHLNQAPPYFSMEQIDISPLLAFKHKIFLFSRHFFCLIYSYILPLLYSSSLLPPRRIYKKIWCPCNSSQTQSVITEVLLKSKICNIDHLDVDLLVKKWRKNWLQ